MKNAIRNAIMKYLFPLICVCVFIICMIIGTEFDVAGDFKRAFCCYVFAAISILVAAISAVAIATDN